MSPWQYVEQHAGRLATDASVSVGAITAPEWLQWFEYGVDRFLVVGGLALLLLRIAVAWRDWRRGRE